MKIVILVLVLSFICSCEKHFNNLDEYENYVNGDNYPLVQSIEKINVKVTLRYLPVDALLLSSYKRYQEQKEKIAQDTSITKQGKQTRLDKNWQQIEKQRSDFENNIYFRVKIERTDEQDVVYNRLNAQGFESYSQWLKKLLFNLNEYIELRTDLVDGVPLLDYQFERSFGMTKYRTALLVFPKVFNDVKITDDENKHLSILIKEFGLKSGVLKFTYDLPLESVGYDRMY